MADHPAKGARPLPGRVERTDSSAGDAADRTQGGIGSQFTSDPLADQGQDLLEEKIRILRGQRVVLGHALILVANITRICRQVDIQGTPRINEDAHRRSNGPRVQQAVEDLNGPHGTIASHVATAIVADQNGRRFIQGIKARWDGNPDIPLR